MARNMLTLIAFEAFLNQSVPDNTVRIGFTVSQLQGIGLEYLVGDGMVRAVFYNGVMRGIAPIGNTEVTKGIL